MPLRSFTPAELLVTERRRIEQPLLALIWLSILAATLAEGNMTYLAAGTFAVGLNLFAVRRAQELYVSRLLVNTGVLLSTGILLLEVLTRVGVLEALGHYLILIQLCKLFERKTNRDYVQMLALSLLLMVAVSLNHQELWFAAILLAHIVLSCHTAMVFTLKRGLDTAASARLAIEITPPAPNRVAWNVTRAWPRPALLGRLAIIMTAIVASGGIIFLLAPRSGSAEPYFMSGFDAAWSLGGPGAVRLGEAREMYQSDRVVMHVRLKAPADSVVPMPFYLRGDTFDRYAESQWSKNHASLSREPSWSQVSQAMLQRAIVQEVSMMPSLGPTLFASYPAIRAESSRLCRPVDADLNVEFIGSQQTSGPLRYTAWSLLEPLGDEDRQWMGKVQAKMRQPDALDAPVYVHPEVARLAEEWCLDLLQERHRFPSRTDELDQAIARRLAEKLGQRCKYTLDLRTADPGRDGVEDFLFHMKKGHCEYFASALTVMCRSLDVQARLATGFTIDQGNLSGDHYLVRLRDAHAWTEIYTPSTDWITVDATPPGELDRPAAGMWASMRQWLDEWQFSWYEQVVGYDDHQRSHLWTRLAAAWTNAVKSVSNAGGNVAKRFTDLMVRGQVDRGVIVAAVTLLVVAIGCMAIVVSHLVARRRRRAHTPAEELSFILRFFGLLERRGLACGVQYTLHESAREAVATLDMPADTMNSLVDLYHRRRWGNQRVTPEELARAKAVVEELRAKVQRRE